MGADVVLHSATKAIGGHSDCLLGIAVTADPDRAEALRVRRTLRQTWISLNFLPKTRFARSPNARERLRPNLPARSASEMAGATMPRVASQSTARSMVWPSSCSRRMRPSRVSMIWISGAGAFAASLMMFAPSVSTVLVASSDG